MAAADLTKLHLCNTFMSMCEDQPIGKITVSALVKRAGVARATFYNNFLDINDLINYIPVYNFTRSGLAVFDPQNVKKAFEFAREHRAFFTQLPKHIGQNNFRETFIAWSQQIGYGCFLGEDMPDDEREYRRLRIDHLCAGHMELLINWCNSDMSWNLDILVQAMYDSTPRFIREGIENTPKSLEGIQRGLLEGRWGSC